MKQITRWSPDTCDCVVEYEWDDAVESKDRIHKLMAVKHKCLAHAHLNNEAVYSAITEENPRKNVALEVALNTALPDGSEEDKRNLRRNIAWSFDGKRRVILELPSTITSMGLAIQGQINSEIGVDKVIIRSK